jgi:hypothetical protein
LGKFRGNSFAKAAEKTRIFAGKAVVFSLRSGRKVPMGGQISQRFSNFPGFFDEQFPFGPNSIFFQLKFDFLPSLKRTLRFPKAVVYFAMWAIIVLSQDVQR